MRIALLTDFPRDIETPVGGVEAAACSLALGFSRCEDLELHVITPCTQVRRVTSTRLSESVTVHRLPMIRKLELSTFFLHHRLVLGPLLRELKPDVVHANALGRYAYACGALRYEYVLTVHGFTSTEQQVLGVHGPAAHARVALMRVVENASWRRAAAIIANSSYVIRRAPTSLRQRISYIPNPVDPLFFQPEAKPACNGRVVWVGVIMRRKGLDLLLRALQIVQRSVPSAHVRLIGPCADDTYLHRLEVLRDELGLTASVEFVGPRHGAALRAEYAAASVFALPSREENVPVAIAEAMAVGVAVVATRVGGVDDLVQDGVTGRLVLPEDIEALARSLVELLADKSARRRMETTARAVARDQFSVDAIIERHRAVYRAMIASVNTLLPEW